jgi:hypothetical protein
MSGKGWYIPRTIDGNLEKFGHPEFTFQGIDTQSLLYTQLEELLNLQKQMEGEDSEAGLFTGQLLTELIWTWDIADPLTGDPLPTPKEDQNSFKRLPVEILAYMIETVMGTAAKEEVVPPETGSER